MLSPIENETTIWISVTQECQSWGATAILVIPLGLKYMSKLRLKWIKQIGPLAIAIQPQLNVGSPKAILHDLNLDHYFWC